MKLAQKHRPVTFDAVIGQDSAVTVMKAIIVRGRYESAYLLSGPSGDGKTTLGRIFSMAMLCAAHVNGNPCGKCESCQQFLREQHFGYHELDAASFGGKDDMVKLRDEAAFVSASSRKIILLDECHDISRQGQDALLKQVEQCPEHLVYLFCTTDPDKMNPTLRNRCMEFQVTKVAPDGIVKRLRDICVAEGFQADDSALRVIADRSKGHVRNAVNLLEEVAFLGPISPENLGSVARDFSGSIYGIVSNLGVDLPAALQAYTSVSSYLSPTEFYDQIISLVDDACRSLYGYVLGLTPARQEMASKLKDIHGFSLLEFLNYLLTRDKFVDRMGMQSDLIVLHYKFSAGALQPAPRRVRMESELPAPQVEVPRASEPQTPVLPTSQKVATAEPPVDSTITYAQLSKMTLQQKSKALCDLRNKVKPADQKNATETVAEKWPLPKDDRPGESSFDDEMLSPQEFSRLLVGGRSG